MFLTIFSKNLCLLLHDFTVFYIPMTNHIHFCNLKDHNVRNFRRPYSVFLMVREIPCAYQTTCSSLYKFIEQMYSYRLIILLSNSPSYFTDFNVVKIHLTCTFKIISSQNSSEDVWFSTKFKQRFIKKMCHMKNIHVHNVNVWNLFLIMFFFWGGGVLNVKILIN